LGALKNQLKPSHASNGYLIKGKRLIFEKISNKPKYFIWLAGKVGDRNLARQVWEESGRMGDSNKKVRPTIGSSRLGLRLSVFVGIIHSLESKYNG
jgi:hypothetical protein